MTAQARKTLASFRLCWCLLFPSPAVSSFLNPLFPLGLLNDVPRPAFLFSFMKRKKGDYVSFICLAHGLNSSLSHSSNMCCLMVVGHMRHQSPRFCPSPACLENKTPKKGLGFCLCFYEAIKHIPSIHSDGQATFFGRRWGPEELWASQILSCAFVFSLLLPCFCRTT